MTQMLVDNTILAPAPPLARRIEALALCAASVEADGGITPLGAWPWLEAMLARSPQVTAMLRRRRPMLEEQSGVCIELLPGVSVAPIADGPAGDGHTRPPRIVLFMVDQHLRDSEHLRSI